MLEFLLDFLVDFFGEVLSIGVGRLVRRLRPKAKNKPERML